MIDIAAKNSCHWLFLSSDEPLLGYRKDYLHVFKTFIATINRCITSSLFCAVRFFSSTWLMHVLHRPIRWESFLALHN